MASFEEQLKAFANKTRLKFNAGVHEIILGVAASVVDRSPVGDPSLWAHPAPKGYVPGTFKANWNGGFGQIDYSTQDETDPSGELSMVRINEAIPPDPIGIFYITNSLPYAVPLENGWSKQAPAGMVGLTILDFNKITVASLSKIAR